MAGVRGCPRQTPGLLLAVAGKESAARHYRLAGKGHALNGAFRAEVLPEHISQLVDGHREILRVIPVLNDLRDGFRVNPTGSLHEAQQLDGAPALDAVCFRYLRHANIVAHHWNAAKDCCSRGRMELPSRKYALLSSNTSCLGPLIS